jgi:hypothetical protein
MLNEKTSQVSVDRRTFLRGFSAFIGLHALGLIFGGFLGPVSGIAQDAPLAPPGLGGRGEDKAVSTTELSERSRALSARLNANAKQNDRHLTPEQQRIQEEELEKILRGMVESNGYKVLPPKNFRIINN